MTDTSTTGVDARQQVIEGLLNDRSHHIEFNGHLTNHNKHAVVALAGLGAPAARIKAYYDNYARRTPYGYALEPPRPSAHVIGEDNWELFLGKRTSYSSYCELFDRRAAEVGLDEVLRRYVPTLLPGWVGSLMHGAIHLGWALDVNSRWMTVEGLAYMAFSYVSCHPERAVGAAAGDESVLDSLLRIAGIWEERREELHAWVEALIAENYGGVPGIHPELVRSGLQYRVARTLGQGHPLIYATPRWVEGPDVAATWERLYHAVTLLYLAVPGDFLLLHLITALHALEQIAARLPAGQQVYAVKCFWVGMLGVLFSRGDFPTRTALQALAERFAGRMDVGRPAEGPTWEEIVARAVEEEEEHNPKMVYVLRRVWGRTGGQSLYRIAAAHFTTTPELPDSFEAPPTE
jgi:hypothetical protein